MTIEVRPLNRAHVETLTVDGPLDIAKEQYGQAAAFVQDGRALAIVGVWDRDGVAETAAILSDEARRYPVSIHRFARDFFAGLHLMGYRVIRAWPDSRRSEKWLERLGFRPANGAYEKWQYQKH